MFFYKTKAQIRLVRQQISSHLTNFFDPVRHDPRQHTQLHQTLHQPALYEHPAQQRGECGAQLCSLGGEG